MALPVYSTQFVSVLAPSNAYAGSTGPIGGDEVWDIRDVYVSTHYVTAAYGEMLPGWFLQTNDFVSIFSSDFIIMGQELHWEGRRILTFGQFIEYELQPEGMSLAVMGYKLTNP